MRGLKAKTMRRVAKDSSLPTERGYRAKIHKRHVFNPAYPHTPGSHPFIEIKQVQVFLGDCQRRMVKRMKRKCPKNSFFGFALRDYRSARYQKPIVQVVEASK